jgi:hypothetical protein
LENSRNREHDDIALADFPGIRHGDWRFCCSLLQMNMMDYEKMKAGAEPPPYIQMMDLESDKILTGLRELVLLAEESSMSEAAMAFINYFEEKHSMPFHSIRKKLLDDELSLLNDLLHEIAILSEDSDYAAQTLAIAKKLRASAPV